MAALSGCIAEGGMIPTYTLDGHWIRRGKGPLVYVWRRGADVLYVGVSVNGLGRPLSSNHHRLTPGAVLDGDALDIYQFTTKEDAIAAEVELIARLRPHLNTSPCPPHPSYTGQSARI